MKSITTELRDHLDQEVTALCTCWQITRVDGTILRFTDADEDVVQDGLTYKSIGAYKRTAIETTSSLSVDNLEIVGASSDLALPEEQLRLGLFDNAEILVFITSWLDEVRGIIRMRRGFFGEVQVLPNNTYQVELRGIMQRLSYNYTDIYSATCLYNFGEPDCGVVVMPDDVKRATAYEAGDVVRAPQDGFAHGRIYELGIGDPDFEIAGPSGSFDNSIYWYNFGVANAFVDNQQAYSNAYSARGGAGVSTLIQDIDLEDTTGLPLTSIDGETCFLTFRSWRRDSADTGRVRVQFLDIDGQALGYGNKIQFNAGSNGLVLGTSRSFLGDFTFEAWIKVASPGFDTPLCGFQDSENTTPSGQRIDCSNGRLTLRINPPNSNDFVQGQSTRLVPAGQWTHVALTRSGTTCTWYIDFNEAGSFTFADPFEIDKVLGATPSSGFIGEADEIRFWEVSRTEYELTRDARKKLDAATPDLVRYYNFDDGTADDETNDDPATIPLPAGASIIPSGDSPVRVPAAVVGNTATYSTGFENVGGGWVERELVDRLIPTGARICRIEFETTGTGARLDNLTGYVIDTSQAGLVAGYQTGDVYYEAGNSGTTAGNIADATYTAGGGLDGGVGWIARNSFTRGGRVLRSFGARRFTAVVNDPRAVDGWFNGGLVTFESGPNAGVSMEVKSWDVGSGEVELYLSVPNNIKPGDLFSIYPGCDKSRISCAAIFNNIRNFFGSPDVPGQDDLLRYPDSK